MSPRSVLALALALVCGGSAVVGVNSFIKNSAIAKGEMAPMVVATSDIPRGGTITAELVRTREFPKELVPPGAISKVEDALDRAVSIPLLRDDPVLNAKLAPKGKGRGLAAMVPKGMRAFTINTTNVASGVAGFALPGHKVDVLFTMGDTAGSHETGGGSTVTLLQNIEILAVDQKIEAPAENKVDASQLRSVTLLVTPDQANRLYLGQSKGTLHLVLRNLEDTEEVHTRPATLADFALSKRKPDAPAPVVAPPKRIEPPPPPLLIRTMRGGRPGGVLIDMNGTGPMVTDLGPQGPKGY